MAPYLKQAHALDQSGKVDDALDVIYDAMDDAFIDGRFDEIDADLNKFPGDFSLMALLPYCAAVLPQLFHGYVCTG